MRAVTRCKRKKSNSKEKHIEYRIYDSSQKSSTVMTAVDVLVSMMSPWHSLMGWRYTTEE